MKQDWTPQSAIVCLFALTVCLLISAVVLEALVSGKELPTDAREAVAGLIGAMLVIISGFVIGSERKGL